jgi:mannitol/fructose-specific phosphotransferase system IIA component (Ntr-type)
MDVCSFLIDNFKMMKMYGLILSCGCVRRLQNRDVLTFDRLSRTVSGMNLKKILSPEVISLHLPGDSKQEIIESLLDLCMKTGKISDRQKALDCILERERKMSTGIQHGVAIPHGKTEAVTDLAACVGLRKDGIDFESLDGEPSRIFIMTVSPINRIGPHVQFLAEVSHLLKSRENRERILAAESVEQVLSLLLE